MKIAVTGGNGRLGKVLIDQLLAHDQSVVSIDWAEVPAPNHQSLYKKIDLNYLEPLTEAVHDCNAIIHLAAILNPEDYPPGVGYINNITGGYNVLSAAESLGIHYICLASSINALGGARSRIGRYDYFPVDEDHPTYNEDDYALSKWIMEQQADSFARRNPEMSISSLRFHALPEEAPELQHSFDEPTAPVARTLWGWTLISEAARACRLAIQAKFHGHQVFFITASRTSSSIPSLELARHAYPDVPIRGDLSGHKSFYDCAKAQQLLGWVHANI